MNKNLSEDISSLVDDQLDTNAALRLVKKLEKSDDAAATYSRYLLIGEVLKSREPVIHGSAFLDKVHAAIEDEPAIIVPDWRKRLREQSVTLALAATLAGLAVVVGTSVMQERERPQLAVAASNADQPALMRDYMSAHNETAYIAANGGLMPYLRVVSGDQSGR
jgi:negative regulator of sigma E activity